MTVKKEVTHCPHADRSRVESIVGTKTTVIETCIVCAAGLLPKLFPKRYNGVPFTLRIETATGGVLTMKGTWEGVPVWLTAKQIGGFLEVWGANDDND